ncbi:hypothetical protein CURTO8I2_170195 [Curtobacterium sp. 8I-2]|nr:hypothetical protein CURTO8I2_170195 [Curtobacterium sp. 8I-2]
MSTPKDTKISFTMGHRLSSLLQFVQSFALPGILTPDCFDRRPAV